MFKDFLSERLLTEMSTVCPQKYGYGFVAKIYSNDHNPPHFHVETTSGELIAKIEIVNKQPETVGELIILEMKDKKQYSKVKQNIISWINSTNMDVNTWSFLKLVWNSFHSNETVIFR